MNQTYSDYLQSPEWRSKRAQRLKISQNRCAACGSTDKVEVHHLTYARIFNEDMEDLLPLCEEHHEAAERIVRSGSLPRTGDVLFLATETIRLVLSFYPKLSFQKDRFAFGPRNRIQRDLVQEAWFMHALRSPRKHFKKTVRAKFEGHPRRNALISNAFALYGRLKNHHEAISDANKVRF